MATVRARTASTTQKLRNVGFNVVEIWEHEFSRMKDENREFIEKQSLPERLKPCDSIFEGRTNANKLYYEINAKYVVLTSLYPLVSYYCPLLLVVFINTYIFNVKI